MEAKSEMSADAPKTDWNELQFLSWGEFKQMAPSIVRLEVTRLGKLLQAGPEDTEFHNGLVRARFALEQFIGSLAGAEKSNVAERCGGHLQTAIVSMSFQPESLDAHTKETCNYILTRLNYILHRISLIY